MTQTTTRPRTRALVHVGDVGASLDAVPRFNAPDVPFPQHMRYEPKQECVWDVGALLGMVLVVGMTLLFWWLIACAVARAFCWAAGELT